MNANFRRLAACLCLGLLGASPAVQSADYTVQLITSDTGNYSNYYWGKALNDLGQVAGYRYTYSCGSYCSWQYDTFRWTAGNLTVLESLGTDTNGNRYNFPNGGINASGSIAGQAWRPGAGYEAALWNADQLTVLGGLGSDSNGYRWAYATNVNDSGQVVGDSAKYVNGSYVGYRAVLWSEGETIELGTLGGDSHAEAINESGQVIGWSNKTVGNYGFRAVLWSGGQAIELATPGLDSSSYGYSYASAINESGEIVGYFDKYDGGWRGLRPMRWKDGQATELGVLGTDSNGYGYGYVGRLNDSGQAIGQSLKIEGGAYIGYTAVLWNDVTPIEISLGQCANTSSYYSYGYASDINNHGQVVGYALDSNCRYRPFLYADGVTTDLNTLLPSDSGWDLYYASDINEAGQILVHGYHGGQWSTALLTPTGQPANNAPVSNAGSDQVVEATGPSGAVVTLNGSGSTDADGDPLTYQWSGSFGSATGSIANVTLGLGTHTIGLTVSDPSGATSTDTVQVTVRDTVAPQLSLPADKLLEALTGAGTPLSYSATASDSVDPSPVVTCSPASGSTFPLGTKTVTCTATDAAGNFTTGSFTVNVVDTIPPTVSVPAPITVHALVPADGAVTYAASASDSVDAHPSLTCSPASGTTFGLGTTNVSCFAADTAGNGSSASFTVTVIDSGAPVLTLPADIAVTATDAAGAAVTYSVSAQDAFDSSPDVTCTPASGSTFAPGTTTVQCTAKDDSGNGASGSFKVRVSFGFVGFFQPVDNLPTVNTVKNGSTVPVKWRLQDASGGNITSTATVAGISYVPSACSGPEDSIEEVASATGGTTLRWDTTGSQFIYNWKTPSLPGKCVRLDVRFTDGTTRSAAFKLK